MRHPFVDLRLLEFVARIPPYPWLVRKRILRDATDGLLPATVRQRPKALLVDSRSSRATPEVRQALAELVTSVPRRSAFSTPPSCAKRCLRRTPTTWQDWILGRPLGLVHWLRIGSVRGLARTGQQTEEQGLKHEGLSDTRAGERLTYRTPEVNSLGTVTDITAAGHGGAAGQPARLLKRAIDPIIPGVREADQYRHYGLTLERQPGPAETGASRLTGPGHQHRIPGARSAAAGRGSVGDAASSCRHLAV